MRIPDAPTTVTLDLPDEERAPFLEQMKQGYDAWLYHYTGNCFDCGYCSHGPPTEAELLPFFRADPGSAASAWAASIKR